MLCSRSLLVIYFKQSSAYVYVYQSHSPNLFPSSLNPGNHEFVFFIYNSICVLQKSSFVPFSQILYMRCEGESCSVMPDSLRPNGLQSQWNSLGQNTGVGSLSLFQGIFPTQGSNPVLSHCRWILYQLSHKGSPRILEWVAYPYSSRSSPPRNQTRVSCIAGGFFTS